MQRGFGYFYGFIDGWTDQYKPKLVRDNAAVPPPATPGYHLTTDLIDHAIAALDADRAAGARPSFVYLALGTAHAPIQAPRSFIDAYAGVDDKGWDAIRQARFARQKALGIIPANTQLPPINPGDRPWTALSPRSGRCSRASWRRMPGSSRMPIQRWAAGRAPQADRAVRQHAVVLVSDNGPALEAGQNGGFWTPYDPKTPLAEMARNLDKLGGPETESLYQRP